MDETLIFHFEPHPGELRAVDPFKAERMIAQALAGDPLHLVIEQARVPASNPISDAAVEKLLAASRLAFGLADVQSDGSGYTEKTQMRILKQFLRWRDDVKKNGAPTPNSAPSTEPVFSANHQTPAMDCGCPEPA